MSDFGDIISVASNLGRAIGSIFGSGSGPSRTERLQSLINAGAAYGRDSPQYQLLEKKYSGIAKKHAALLSKLPTAADIASRGAMDVGRVAANIPSVGNVLRTIGKSAGKLLGPRLIGPASIAVTVADSILKPGPAYDKLTERKLVELANQGDKRAMAELQKRRKAAKEKREKPRPGRTPPGQGAQTPTDPVPPGNPGPARPSIITAPKESQVKLFLQGFLGGLVQGIPQLLTKQQTGTRVAVSLPPSPFNAIQPQQISSVTYLTGPSAAGVPSTKTGSGKCKCPPKRKGKPRQPRTECWGGTYIETATGLRKTKRRRVAC